VPIARLHVRTALGFHGLAGYGEDAEIITSELVTNAVQHAGGGGETIRVTLARTWNPGGGDRRCIRFLLRRPGPA
jgi:anti-sigma regulatory factor (Ser/Thr protein kinase)